MIIKPTPLIFCTNEILCLSSVRVLAFSPHGIKSVQVWLDGHPLPPASQVGEHPLYTTPWDPAQVASGVHTIAVAVQVNQML